MDELLAPAGPAAIHGVRWFPSRPPIEGLEFELDMRGVGKELGSDAMRAARWGVAVLAIAVALAAPVAASESATARRLGILIASAWKDDTSTHADAMATYQVLRQRGFAPEELMVLSGPLTRSGLLAFLHDVRRRLASWDGGEVWLSYSGHGFYEGRTAAEARPGLLLTGHPMPPGPEQQIFWDDVFVALGVPASVQLTLLPDC